MNTWTRERPAEPGFYWLRQGRRVRIVEIRANYVCMTTSELPVPLGTKALDDAEWYGPLSPPE